MFCMARWIFVPLCVAFGLGCASERKPPDLSFRLPQEFPYAQRISLPKREAQGEILSKWWESFGDPQLVRLVEEALKANPSVKEALARIEEAKALKAQGASEILPQIGIGASVQRQEANQADGATAYSSSVESSLQLDLFGKTKKGIEALQEGVLKEEENLNHVLSELASEVATAYVELCASQKELLLLKERLQRCETQYRDLVLSRYRAGLTDHSDLEQAQREMALLRYEILQKEREIETQRASLCALLGRPPGTLEALEIPDEVPLPPLQVVMASPAEVIERRPDVRMAKREASARVAYLEEAKRSRLPTLKLLGSLALEALTLGDLIHYPFLTLRIGPSLDLDLFTGGGKAGQIRQQEAKLKQALVQYERAVLEALREVQQILCSIQTHWGMIQETEKVLEAAREILKLEEVRYLSGLSDYEGVIQQRKSLYETQISLADLKAQLALDFVDLYKALGGGWQTEEQDGRKEVP